MGVYKRGERWWLDFQYERERIREPVTVEGKTPDQITFRDAEKALAIRKAEIATGKFKLASTKKPVRFDKLVEAYLEWADENLRAPVVAHSACKNLLAFFKEKNVYALNLFEVERYKAARKKQGRKPETINKELGALRRMFNLAVAGTLSVKVGRNPVQGLKLLEVPKTKVNPLKDWEFEKLYEASPEHLRLILLIAYLTGMRRDEIRKLKWKDVDLEDGYIHVIETKNNESRSIPVAGILLSSLKDAKAKADERAREAQEEAPCEYVATGPDGKPYLSKTAWKTAWTKALKDSGIERRRFHILRHTFVSRLTIDMKEDPATVMALSGHKDIRVLMRYSHTREDAKKAAIQKLEDPAKSAIVVTKTVTSDKDDLSAVSAVININGRNN